MLAVEEIDKEIARLDAVEARRGILWEDEKVRRDALCDVVQWFKRDKAEAERIELEAMEAEEVERLEREANDPNRKTKELFKGVKINVPETKGYRK